MPIYFTHDNGGRPFMVDVNTKTKKIEVFIINLEAFDSSEESKYIKKDRKGNPYLVCYNFDYSDTKFITRIYSNSVYKTNYHEIFIGNDLNPKFKDGGTLGNSILINKNGKEYIFIGHEIYSFTPHDHIKEYHSIVGNSDVPYPFAIGEKNVYFMIEDQYVSLAGFLQDELKDPYCKLYGHHIPNYFNYKHNKYRINDDEKNEIKMYDLWQKLYIKKFQKKILVKRSVD
jgi:hypothetical protein